ncbi:hypothetical protein EVAR_4872_1 [Eumeta japonica]|uniref:Uncharacterized protein n=1 Tax=Eumeta variegata TaxID=151549 RepID=A0A4C1SZ51_EUMVA|nr:hypothetical protein EVAR_4872_1 [Eumeta japonica]
MLVALRNAMYPNPERNIRESDTYRSFCRRTSLVRVSCGETLLTEVDTFEHILNVTTHNDALLAYYYLDDNKMKITEIYDVTEADTDVVQSPTERDANKQLEFDNDWAPDLMPEDDEIDMAAMDDDDLGDSNIFSDPESEWARRGSMASRRSLEEDQQQPESDQIFPISNVYSVTHPD